MYYFVFLARLVLLFFVLLFPVLYYVQFYLYRNLWSMSLLTAYLLVLFSSPLLIVMVVYLIIALSWFLFQMLYYHLVSLPQMCMVYYILGYVPHVRITVYVLNLIFAFYLAFPLPSLLQKRGFCTSLLNLVDRFLNTLYIIFLLV